MRRDRREDLATFFEFLWSVFHITRDELFRIYEREEAGNPDYEKVAYMIDDCWEAYSKNPLPFNMVYKIGGCR